MSTAADAFEDAILDELHAYVSEIIGDRVESPIEYKFAFALILAMRLTRHDFNIVAGNEASRPDKSVRYTIRCQAPISEAARVDFGIYDRHHQVGVVVECDGRDFHHSTRSQIERDRQRDAELAVTGIRVLRFPGTQIHNSPFQCAMETLQLLNQLAEQQKGVA